VAVPAVVALPAVKYVTWKQSHMCLLISFGRTVLL
jgi:hypothetical protein